MELIFDNFTWTVNPIEELYKSRRQVKIFFREIKQLLCMKSFRETSKNVVPTQLWTVLIPILILKHLKAIGEYACNGLT